MELTNEIDRTFIYSNNFAIDNCLKETPIEYLSREYPLFTNQSYTTFSFQPHYLLFNTFSTIFDAFMKTMRYIRSGVKLSFVQNSSPNTYGCAVISWLPNVGSSAPVQTINADPILVDISSRETVELNIPYVGLGTMYRYATTPNGQFPTVYFETLGVYTTDSSINQPTFSVYASLLNPQALGALAQSGNSFGWEDALGIAQDVHSKGLVSGVLHQVYNNPKYLSGAAQAFSSVSSHTHKLLKESVSRFQGAQEVVDNSVEDRLVMVRNQTYGDMAGSVYTPSLTMASNHTPLIVPNHLCEHQLRHRIRDIIRIPCITEWFPLDGTTPTSTNFFLRNGPWEVDVHGSVFNYSTYMDEMANLFRFRRGSVKHRLMFYTSPLIQATVRLTLYYTDNQNTVIPNADTRWSCYNRIITIRGTTQYDFTVPFLYSCQFDGLGGSGGFQQKTAVVILALESPPAPVGDNTAHLLVVHAIGAGDDFQFHSLRSPHPDYFDSGKAQAQMNLRSSWSGEFPNLAGGSNVYPTLRDLYEDDMTYEDVLSRYSTRYDTQFSTLGVHDFLLNTIQTNPAHVDTFDFLLPLFRFVRGSIRIKYQSDPSVPFPYIKMKPLIESTNLAIALDVSAGDGLICNSTSQNEALDFEVPYYSQFDFITTNSYGVDYSQPAFPSQEAVQVDFNASLATTNQRFFVASGRDFQVAFLMPPRSYNLYPVFLPS